MERCMKKILVELNYPSWKERRGAMAVAILGIVDNLVTLLTLGYYTTSFALDRLFDQLGCSTKSGKR